MEALVQGPYGTAELLEIPVMAAAAELVCHWLINGQLQTFHPFFDTWTLSVVRLTDGLPGFPDPHHTFEGTTHEMVVCTLNPEEGPYDAEKMAGYATGGLPLLTPINVCEQFIATDDEMRELAYFGAKAIVNGKMSPEPPFSAQAHSKSWLVAMTKTLAHIRGEEHAS